MTYEIQLLAIFFYQYNTDMQKVFVSMVEPMKRSPNFQIHFMSFITVSTAVMFLLKLEINDCSQSILSVTQNSRENWPPHGNFGDWRMRCTGYTVIYPFHLNFPEVVVELWEARLSY